MVKHLASILSVFCLALSVVLPVGFSGSTLVSTLHLFLYHAFFVDCCPPLWGHNLQPESPSVEAFIRRKENHR